MAKPKCPVDVGDSVEVIIRSGVRTPGAVVTVKSGLVEVAFRKEDGRSALTVTDDKRIVPVEATRWAFDLTAPARPVGERR